MKARIISAFLFLSLSLPAPLLLSQNASAWIGNIPSCDLGDWNLKQALETGNSGGMVPNLPTLDNTVKMVVYRGPSHWSTFSSTSQHDYFVQFFSSSADIKFSGTTTERRLESFASVTNGATQGYRFTGNRVYVQNSGPANLGLSNINNQYCIQWANNIGYDSTYTSRYAQNFKSFDFEGVWEPESGYDDGYDDGYNDGIVDGATGGGGEDGANYPSFGFMLGAVVTIMFGFLIGFALVRMYTPKGRR